MTRFILLFFVLFAFSSTAFSQEVIPPEVAALEGRFTLRLTKEQMHALLDDVEETLKVYPENVRLLMLSHSLHTIFDDKEGIRRDATRLAKIRHTVPEVRFGKCMSDEFFEGDSEEVVQCYRDILPLFDEQDRDSNPLYILIASFAKLPEAEALRKQYVHNAAPTMESEIYKWFFTHFSRDMFNSQDGPDIFAIEEKLRRQREAE